VKSSLPRGIPVQETPEELLLSKVATRLVQLLEASKNQRADRAEAVAMLEDRDLYQGGALNPNLSPFQFAGALIEDDLQLQSSVGYLRHSFDPKASETVGDLISHLLPGGTLD
jgi:hypothetical protein